MISNEQKIMKLDRIIDDLSNELEKYKVNLTDSLHDSMKTNIFLELHNNYSPWEFEKLLLNGKEYLKNENSSNK